MIDISTMRLLRDLPIELRSRGWRLVTRECHAREARDRRSCVAVYARPFEPGVDHDRYRSLVDVVDVEEEMVIAIERSGSCGWEDVFAAAVERMQQIERDRP